MKVNKILIIVGALAPLALTACESVDNQTGVVEVVEPLETEGSQEFTFDDRDGGDGVIITIDGDGNETIEVGGSGEED